MSKTQYIRFCFLWVAVLCLFVFIKKSTAETLIALESLKIFFVYFPLLLAMSLMTFRGYLDFSFIGWFGLFSAAYYYFSQLEAFSFLLLLSIIAFVGLVFLYAHLLIRAKFPSVMLSVLFIVLSLTLQNFMLPNPLPIMEDTNLTSATLERILNPTDFKSYLLLLLSLIFMWLAFHLIFRLCHKPTLHKQAENKNTSFFLFIFYILMAAFAAFLQNKLGLMALQNPIHSAYYTTFYQVAFFFAALSLAGFSLIGGKNGSFHAVPSLIILLLCQQILMQAGLKDMRIVLYWLPLLPFIILALAIVFDQDWFKRYRMLISIPSEPLILEGED